MRRADECGMTTAEYAVGTVAAAGFGGGLLLVAPVYFGLVRWLLDFVVEQILPTIVPL